jgi:TonB-dependent receptor
MGNIMSFKFLLLASTATFVSIAAPATAQTQTAPLPAQEVETIVVTGSRPIQESDRAALNVQRNSVALVSVLSADEAGRLADQNIADALSRLPGIAIEKDQGQARYVNLRGQPRRWVNISIDGINVVSPEGRDTRYDNIPTAIASQIVVNKAVTPDMPGDSVAGNVNIRTRSAFDYRDRRITGNLQVGRLDLGGGREIDTSLVVADKFFDDKLGILAQASFYEREMITDNWETDPYLRPGGTNLTATGTSVSGIDRRPGSETRRWAREYENKPYRLTRGNISGSLRADWRPNDTDKLFFQTVYSQFTDIELRNNYIFRLDNGSTNTAATPCPVIVAPQTTSGVNDICNGNTPQKGTVYGAQIRSNFRTGDIKEYIFTTSVGGEHETLGWNLDWRLNFTETEDGQDLTGTPSFESPANTPANITLRPTVDYDFTDVANNTVRLFRTNVVGGVRSRGAAVTNIEDFPMNFVDIISEKGGDITSAWTGKIDATRNFTGAGFDTTIKVGGLYTTRTKKRRITQYRATAANFTTAGVAAPTYNDIAIDGPFQGSYALGYNFRYYSGDKVGDLIASLKARNIGSFQDGSAQFYEVTEDILAGYAMATTKTDWGSVVIGGRVERTENTSTALPQIGANRVLTTIKNDDFAFYPSFHVNYDLSDEMKLRFNINTGASRPDFDELAPNFSIDDAPNTISGGNPDAKPERAIGLDAYFEYYMAPQGYLQIGFFYKKVSDALFQQQTTFGSTALNTPDRDRSGYSYTTVRNGGDGFIRGLDLAYNQFAEPLVENIGLPKWMGGFGIRLSATLSESEITVPATILAPSGVVTAPRRKSALPGASDAVYNAALVYEKYDWSLKLAYQYRTKWLQAVGGYITVNNVVVPDGNGDIYWNDSEGLNFSARYELNKNLEFTFDAVNLLDSPGRRYADSEANPIEYETFGARYMVGFKFKY